MPSGQLVSGDTNLITYQGTPVSVQSVQRGRKLISDEGYSRVLVAQKKTITPQDKVYGISTYNGRMVYTLANFKFWCLPKQYKNAPDAYNFIRSTPAESIQIDDFLVSRVKKVSCNSIQVDLLDYLGDKAFIKNGLLSIEVQKKKEKKIVSTNFPRFVEIDEDFLYFLGSYIECENNYHTRNMMRLHVMKFKILERMCDFLNRYSIPYNYKREFLYCLDKVFFAIMNSMLDGERSKRYLRSKLFNENISLLPFAIAVCDRKFSDGIPKKNSCRPYGFLHRSTNPILCRQLNEIFYSAGFAPLFYLNNKKFLGKIQPVYKLMFFGKDADKLSKFSKIFPVKNNCKNLVDPGFFSGNYYFHRVKVHEFYRKNKKVLQRGFFDILTQEEKPYNLETYLVDGSMGSY